MNHPIRIGMDTSKHVFQLHGVDGSETVVMRRQFRRSQMVEFFTKLAPTVIGIEACGASHHWARALEGLGHTVKLLAPQLVKPYVKRGKNDAADAEALCEAMSPLQAQPRPPSEVRDPWSFRPTMRFVPVKTADQQGALMLAGMREALIRHRTQVSNAIRGYAAEFGLVAAKGVDKIEPLLTRIACDESLPALVLDLFAVQAKAYAALEAQVREIEAKLAAWFKSSESANRLAKIPGIGPIGACLLVMKTPDPKAFRSGRDFAAWLGLTPKDHSTAGKTKLGGITRAGDEALRSTLVVGATAVIQQVRRAKDRPASWLSGLLDRKPPKLAAVALANKTARIAWRLMATGEGYNAGYKRPAAEGLVPA